MAAALTWIAANAPAITAAIQAGSMIKGLWDSFHQPKPPPMPEPPPTLSWDEALQRAKSIYNPLYDEQLQKTMENLDKQAIARGIFGQLPAEALRRETAAQVERDRANAISQLAQQLVGQSEQQALEAQRLAMQYAMNNWNTQLANQIARTNALIEGTKAGLQGFQTVQELFPGWWSKTFGVKLGDMARNAPAVYQQAGAQGVLGQLGSGMAPATQGSAGRLQYEYGFVNPYGAGGF